MDKPDALKGASSLDGLAVAHSRASVMNSLRSLFDKVVNLIEKDVPLEVIVKSLNEDGLKITLPHFKSAMSKIRKEKGLGRSKRIKSELLVPPASQPASTDENVIDVEAKGVNHDGDKNIVDAETKEVGIVDIFTIQAEREAKKGNATFQKIPRR